MNENEAPSMQCNCPIERMDRSILAVPENWMSHMSQLNPQLVGSSGSRPDCQPCQTVGICPTFVRKQSFAAARRSRRNNLDSACGLVFFQPRIEVSRRFLHPPLDYRPIALFNGPFAILF